MFDEMEFLNLAGELSDGDNVSEAAYRTAAGRAYYAAFHRAKCLVDGCPEIDERKGTHERILLKLEHATNHSFPGLFTAVRVIGSNLRRAKMIRAAADYTLNVPFDGASTAKAIETSKRIVNEVDRVEQALSAKNSA